MDRLHKDIVDSRAATTAALSGDLQHVEESRMFVEFRRNKLHVGVKWMLSDDVSGVSL